MDNGEVGMGRMRKECTLRFGWVGGGVEWRVGGAIEGQWREGQRGGGKEGGAKREEKRVMESEEELEEGKKAFIQYAIEPTL